jgi:hypothetical protein
MYKGKITEVSNNLYKVNIPSLDMTVSAHLIITKGVTPSYSAGDLVVVSKLNTGEYIIIGYVFNGN